MLHAFCVMRREVRPDVAVIVFKETEWNFFFDIFLDCQVVADIMEFREE